MTSQPPSVPAPRSGSGPGPPPERIVVAVDGSEASVRALVWAFGKARELGVRVEALTTWPLQGVVFVREVAGHFCEPRWHAREVQAAAVARALARIDDAPPYELRVVNAELGEALVRAAGRARFVVAGTDHPAGAPGSRLTKRLLVAMQDRLVLVGPDGEEMATPPAGSARHRSG